MDSCLASRSLPLKSNLGRATPLVDMSDQFMDTTQKTLKDNSMLICSLMHVRMFGHSSRSAITPCQRCVSSSLSSYSINPCQDSLEPLRTNVPRSSSFLERS